MQKLKNFNWKNFFLQGVLPFALAITAAFIARYQLELSDGVTPDFLAMQWPLYAPLNALTAFCLTLVLFAILGKWSRATGISGALFTVIALINYYTRDLHGSALMPQDILNLGTAAEVMGSYTLQITATVRTIILWYLPVLAIAFVQGQLVRTAPSAPAGAPAVCGYWVVPPVCSAYSFSATLGRFRSSPKPPTVGPGRIPIISTATWPVPSRPPA